MASGTAAAAQLQPRRKRQREQKREQQPVCNTVHLPDEKLRSFEGPHYWGTNLQGVA